MQPQDLLTWIRATAFKPFRLTMNSGNSYEIRHPELVRLLRSSMILFTPGDQPDIYDRAEMIGLVLVERIEPLEAVKPKTNGPA